MVLVQKKINIHHRQLRKSGGIEVVGSVPAMQVYSADKKEYTPDYTLAPLTLLPRCNATDPAAVSVIGNINAKLVNMKWYERIGNTRTLIETANLGYAVTQEGAEKGKITVKKNISTMQPVTLEFEAEYIDTGRTGESYKFRYTKLLRTIDATAPTPTLHLDSPSGGLDWNPTRDVTNQAITVKMIVGDKDVTDSANCRFFWYRLVPATGALQPVTAGGANDYEVVSLTKNVLTINRDLMGREVTYVVKASYSGSGEAPAVPDEGIAQVTTVIRRKIPAYECDWKGVPTDVPPGTKYIYPKAIIRDTVGDIPNPEKHFKITWYRQEASGALTAIGGGAAPRLPFNKDMILVLEVADLGPWCLVVAGNPARQVVTGTPAKYIIARKSI